MTFRWLKGSVVISADEDSEELFLQALYSASVDGGTVTVQVNGQLEFQETQLNLDGRRKEEGDG